MKILFAFFILVYHQATTMANLRKAFEWQMLDFDYPSEMDRNLAKAMGTFVPEEIIPAGIDVYEDRLFITTPRWAPGVPVSLSYVMKTDQQVSPKLHPYPNWEYHDVESPNNVIYSALSIRVDNCKRLWVLDVGIDSMNITTRRLLIFNLKDDTLLRSYEIPKSQLFDISFFSSLAVEDTRCDHSFAYVGDFGMSGLIVYSWRKETSWRVSHNFFSPDPLAGEFAIANDTFYWNEGIFGLALAKHKLYFHPLSSTNEFVVPTMYLQNPDYDIQESYKHFRLLGSRGPQGQSRTSFCDRQGILFYSLVNKNAIGCCNTNNYFSKETQGIVYKDDEGMVFPSDLKVDVYNKLWVLSNRFTKFLLNGEVNSSEVNFRIFSGQVEKLVNNTVCDPKKKLTSSAGVKVFGKITWVVMATTMILLHTFFKCNICVRG